MIEYTKKLAELVVNTDYEDLPEEVIRKAKILMIDTLSCAVAGYTEAKEEVSWAIELAKGMGGPPESSIWIDNTKVSAMAAALANGCMVHTIDFDDTHLESIAHIGCGVLGSILPLAQKMHCDGKDVVTAYVLGVEIAARVGNSVNKGSVHYHFKYWHPTATFDTIGAAAACAKIMKFNVEQTRMCIGLGLDQAAGFRYSCISGDYAKTLHAGWAAMRGVMSSNIIAAGATGPVELLGDPLGFCTAMCAEPNMDYLIENLGQEWAVMKDCLKFYPCIQGSHAGVEAVTTIVTEHDVDPEEIESITIRLSPLAPGHGTNYHPDTVMAARLSIPFCIATAATKKRVGLRDFNDETLKDEKFLNFMQKIKIVPSPEFLEAYPDSGFSSEATIVLKDGKTYKCMIPYCKGHSLRPIDDKDVMDKYFMLTAITWPKEHSEKVYEGFSCIETFEDIGELVEIINSAD